MVGVIPLAEGGFKGQVCFYVHFVSSIFANSDFQMWPAKLCRYVNMFLLPSLNIESTISEITAVRWLKKLRFKLQKVEKGVYVDGHECEDVVKSCHDFIEYMYTDVLL